MKINQISPQDNNYTKVLTSIAKPPKNLYTLGTLPTERVVSVAIVGTRKPTKYGREVTEKLAADLAKKGVIIVSGLALGIDGIAHRSTLDAGGTTIAILGNGLPEIYPASHTGLAKDIIASGGAIICEYPAGTPSMPYHFLERNRLVSGIADAIIITEAASRSGTLNTAAHALEQGKTVFVVPGNITSPMSTGCNLLLKQGAIPITDVNDILEVIAPQLLTSQANLALGQNELESAIIQQIQAGVRDGEQIQATIDCPTSELSVALTMLEINGVIRSLGANQWTLR